MLKDIGDKGISMTPEFRRQLSRLLATHWNISFLQSLQNEVGDDYFLAWCLQTFSFYSLPSADLTQCVKKKNTNEFVKVMIEGEVNWAEFVFKVFFI